MAAVLPAAASVRVRDLLRATPDGELRVVHRGPRAIYAALPTDGGGETAIGVVAAYEVLLPVALHVTPRAAPLAVDRVEVRAGALHLDGVSVPVVRTVDMRVPDLATWRGRGAGSGVDPQFVGRLLGRGPGLTPVGDDLLIGWVAAYRACGVPTPRVDAEIARLAPSRTTLLSASLLACAVRGDVPPRLSSWLAAAGTEAEPEAASRLLELGQSSGAAMRNGARAALRELAESDLSPTGSDASAAESDASAGGWVA